MHTMVAFYESIDPGGAMAPIAAVAESYLTVSGDDIYVPEGASNIIGEHAMINDASGVRAQFRAPSLRLVSELDVEPVVLALVNGNPPEIQVHPLNPIPLTPGEALNVEMDSNPAAAAVHQAFVMLSDGAVQPVSGRMHSIRATGAITLSAGVWVNGALTFAQELPVGEYDVVGMRARGTNLVAARLVFPGYPWRPGVIACNAIADRDPMHFRYGRLGVWGRFHSLRPPTLDAFGVTDTAQVVILDVIKV